MLLAMINNYIKSVQHLEHIFSVFLLKKLLKQKLQQKP